MTRAGVVLTGASGGLGRALAAELAHPGRAILLLGRNSERLRAAKAAAEARGAFAETAVLPVEEHVKLRYAIGEFSKRYPIELVVVNAGVKCGNKKGIEPMGQTGRVVDVNLTGAIATVEAVLPSMLANGRGQVAFLSSLAARSPQPDLLSYSASKAALAAYGVALRRQVKTHGLSVSVVFPGFVDTPMTARHAGPKPFLMDAATAAKRIVRGLELQQRTIAFPFPLALLARLDSLLPGTITDRLVARLSAHIEPDADEISTS